MKQRMRAGGPVDGRRDDFQGKIAVVTGAGRGLGRCVALEFPRRGARVACVARTKSDLDKVVGEIEALGGTGLSVPCDVSRPEEVQAMASRVRSILGPVDMLFNNAGIQGKIDWVVNYDPDEWDRIFAVNLKSVFLCTKAVLPGMIERRSGKIVNTAAGVMDERVDLGVAAYYAAKAGVVNFTRQIAAEVKRYGIHVNAIDPAGMSTHMSEEILAAEVENDEFAWTQTNRNPSNRLRPPEAIVPLVMYLFSSASDMMTGRLLQASAPDEVQYLQL